MLRSRRALDEAPSRSFEVVCAGYPRWTLGAPSAPRRAMVHGAPRVALALARERVRVGLCTVFADDEAGREASRRCAAAGVDVGGVRLAASAPAGLLVVDAGGGTQLVAARGEEAPLEVPSAWSCSVLLLSGLNPAVEHAAAACRAARAARRDGALVVVDFDASLRMWAGRDGRTALMVLREAHVARCSVADLAVLGMDPASARAALRPDAILVVSDGLGGVVASGPFGDALFTPPQGSQPPEPGSGDVMTACICADLTRRGPPGESATSRWHRTLRRAYGPESWRARPR